MYSRVKRNRAQRKFTTVLNGMHSTRQNIDGEKYSVIFFFPPNTLDKKIYYKRYLHIFLPQFKHFLLLNELSNLLQLDLSFNNICTLKCSCTVLEDISRTTH